VSDDPGDEIVPAWSEPFMGSGPAPAPPLRLEAPITREWAYGDGSGRRVRVAIVDSGVAPVPAVGTIARSVAVERNADGDVVVADCEHDDLTGHGTACAAIIRSLAPDVELVSVRVLGATLKGQATTFAHGLEWCIEHGFDVVNLSLSTSNQRYFDVFHDLVDTASWRRTLLVSAMNNVRKLTIPSEFAGVFSVACSPGRDREELLHNPDGPAEWAAAGIDVEVEWGTTGTMTATGNSFAAPVIAGHLARIRGAHPGIAPWQARTVLAALATDRPPLP
jgi:subtilisin